MHQKINIVVEGVVGAGKSTLMNILSKQGFSPFPEPVINHPFLDKMYSDIKRYSFPTQIYYLNKRFQHLKEIEKLKKTVSDRSIYCDMIFAKMFYDNGEMSKDEFETYKELVNNIFEYISPPTLMIYLEMSVDASMDRIRKRGREYELKVGREYWERLNNNYKEYFKTYDYSPLLIINVDKLDFENNIDDQKHILFLIEEKISSIIK